MTNFPFAENKKHKNKKQNADRWQVKCAMCKSGKRIGSASMNLHTNKKKHGNRQTNFE